MILIAGVVGGVIVSGLLGLALIVIALNSVEDFH